MNCLPNISIALTLLSLIAGAWFLNKSQKENSGILYKIVAWIVIIGAILNILCCGMRCMRHCGGEGRYEWKGRHGHGGGCERGGEQRCGMYGGDYYNIRTENCWMGDKELRSGCEEGEECDEESCEGEGKSCEMKKDSIKKGK
jgi:hypothetical protein